MDRPSRHRKTVNYSDFLGDDDEDFAAAPPNKKARASVKESQQERNRKTTVTSAKQTGLTDITGKGCKERVALDEKLYKRDLEAALSLSLLQATEAVAESLTSGQDNEKPFEDSPPVLTHFSADSKCLEQDKSSRQVLQDLPPVLSNCSVDVSKLGLDLIVSDQSTSPASPRQRKPCKAPQLQQQVLQEGNDGAGDEDYKPQNTPESDTNSSDLDESEDEEYMVKQKRKKKKTANERNTAAKAVKKKRPGKSGKAESQSTALNRSPAISQPVLKRTPTTPPVTKPSLCSSPTEGRLPKWNPPGLVGRSPSTCLSGAVKSPGSGLRLGLSRLARVKPLHPNTAAH